MPPRRAKRYLPTRMRLMKLNTTLHIQFRRSELPDRAIELLDLEPGGCHRVQEILPGNVAGRIGLVRDVEEDGEDFVGAAAEQELGLLLDVEETGGDGFGWFRSGIGGRSGGAGQAAGFGLVLGSWGFEGRLLVVCGQMGKVVGQFFLGLRIGRLCAGYGFDPFRGSLHIKLSREELFEGVAMAVCVEMPVNHSRTNPDFFLPPEGHRWFVLFLACQ